MMDIPIELFLGFIGVSIALAIFGFLRNPQIPATIVMGGMFILTISVTTDSIIMGFSDTDFIPEEISYNVLTNTGNTQIWAPTNAIKAERPATSSSILLGDIIDCMQIYLVKVGSPSVLFPVQFGVFDSSGTLIKDFGSLNITTIQSGTAFYYTMCLDSGDTYEIGSLAGTNERIGIKYLDGNSTNRIDARADSGNPFDGTNTVISAFNSGTMTWTDTNTTDLTMTLYLREHEDGTNNVLYEFTELPKTLFALIGVMIMLVGGLMVMRE